MLSESLGGEPQSHKKLFKARSQISK
jgi:hypothetical protein